MLPTRVVTDAIPHEKSQLKSQGYPTVDQLRGEYDIPSMLEKILVEKVYLIRCLNFKYSDIRYIMESDIYEIFKVLDAECKYADLWHTNQNMTTFFMLIIYGLSLIHI